METEKFVFFWGGPFSQWYKHDMTIDGVKYNCCEQYMMARKALLFNDLDSHSKIMATRDPSKQKAFGRLVKNFDAQAWNAVCRQIVYKANLFKFSDPSLKLVLLGTGNREIVEASPYDRIWGIGMGEDDPNILDKSRWRGTNWLGEELMNVREFLRNEG